MRRNSDSDLAELENPVDGGDALFRGFFEQTGVAMAVADSDGLLLRVNPAFAELVGSSEVELEGRSLLNITHPEDVRRSAVLLASAESAPINSFTHDMRYVRADRAVIPVRTTLSRLYDDEGLFQGYSVVVAVRTPPSQ